MAETKNRKRKLGVAIRERLQADGTKQQEFALNERLAHNSFRSQMTRNTFAPRTLRAAANLLTGGDLKRLEDKYDFETTTQGKETVLSPTQSIQQRVGRAVRQEKTKLPEDIKRLYSWLGENGEKDLVVICGLNEFPLEYTPTGWNNVKSYLKQAVERGAVFVYVQPSEQIIKAMSEPLWEFFPPRTPREQHKVLQNNLIGEGLPAERVREQVRLLEETDWCPFWAIGMRFGLYVTQDRSGSREISLLARFPFARDQESDPDLLLYGDKRMRDAFLAYLFNRFENRSDFKRLIERLR